MKIDSFAFIIIAYHPEAEGFARLLRILPSEETIVVDNGQTLVSDDVGRATLISQSKNLGYGAAANIGIRHAIAHGAEWFVVINQDVAVNRAAVDDMTKQLSKLEPCIAGPFTGGIDCKRWTTILPSLRTDYISGSCIAIHRKVIEKIGYFYEPYFLYYEEADYCVRAKRAGFSLRRLDIESISHEESVSLGRGSSLHQYYLARNHLLFLERQAPDMMKLREAVRFPKTITEHIRNREQGALMGIRDYLFRRLGPYGGRL